MFHQQDPFIVNQTMRERLEDANRRRIVKHVHPGRAPRPRWARALGQRLIVAGFALARLPPATISAGANAVGPGHWH